MSYTYLLEQGEESSAASFSDIPLYVLSRLNLTAGESCSKGSGTASCQSSQSGMMSPPSMGNHGEENSMSSAEDSLARTSAQQARALEFKENEAASGEKWPESLAKYDPASSSWRTAQCLLFEDLGESLETFPRWGMMRSGECWERIIAERPTSETESGYWPTPAARDYKGANSLRHVTVVGGGRKHMDQLANAVAYPDLRGCPAHAVMIGGATSTECTLENAHALKLMNGTATHTRFATPQSRDWRSPAGKLDRWNNPERSRNLNDQIGGQLNPPWVEWLMGWPIGWADLKPLEMDKFQQWQHSHFKFLEGSSND